jgi:hypothetical protein
MAKVKQSLTTKTHQPVHKRTSQGGRRGEDECHEQGI